MSMGMAAGGHQTPNGTYYVLDKKAKVVMDSSTYGVPVNSTYGYKVDVQRNSCIDNYVTSSFTSIGLRGDGYPQWQSAAGNLYCVSFCCFCSCGACLRC